MTFVTPRFSGVYLWRLKEMPDTPYKSPSEIPEDIKNLLAKKTGATHFACHDETVGKSDYLVVVTKDRYGDHLYLANEPLDTEKAEQAHRAKQIFHSMAPTGIVLSEDEYGDSPTYHRQNWFARTWNVIQAKFTIWMALLGGRIEKLSAK